MKLFLAQIECEWKEPVPYEYGDVSDTLMARILVMGAKITLHVKEKFTMQGLIDSVNWSCCPDIHPFIKYWTNGFRKPKDVLFCGAYISTQLDAIVMQWDYTDEWKARDQKRRDKELHKAVSDYERRMKRERKKDA